MEQNDVLAKKTILIIDGYHLLHKGFYGSLKRNKNSINKDGILVNAVYTFISKINECISKQKYHTIIVTFDVGNSCWRKEIYPEYKAKRKDTPEELLPQMQIVRNFLTDANIPWYERPTFEGDDIMGTISRIAIMLGYKIEILSNDKDIYQLVNENVTVVSKASRSAPEVFVDTKTVIEEFQCLPSQIPDIKSLMGDSSDNLKGVTGLHYKTAQQLLEKYRTVENIFNKIDEIEDKNLSERLLRNKDKILMNKELATIKTNVDLGRINLRSLKVDYYGWSKFLYENGMYSFLKTIKPALDRQKEFRRAARIAKETAIENGEDWTTKRFEFYKQYKDKLEKDIHRNFNKTNDNYSTKLENYNEDSD
ncbi:5'-3' exonuclease [Spiroplasma endosymbiont of Labia minor]|uniref:5'-3' exonuclease n=1 Tax=Spiroplasma endosymbiont of Labia minor TaxID=3066305 RepID=UPI0030D5E948